MRNFSVLHKHISPTDFSTTTISNCFVELVDCVRKFSGREVILVPNTGNAGDGLLAFSAQQFLNEAGVNFRVSEDWSQTSSDDVVFLSPGGALIHEYQGFYEDLCRGFIQTDAREVILLPNTVHHLFNPSAFDSDRLTIFCRDRKSFAYCSSQLKKAKVHLAPDLALSRLLSNRQPTIKPFVQVFTQMNFSQRIKLVRFVICSMLVAHTSLTLYRTDIEATIPTSGTTNVDLASYYNSKFLIDGEAEVVSFFLFKALRQRKSIRTNRLHTVISGILCNKVVTYCDNSYGKIEAVFDVAGVVTKA